MIIYIILSVIVTMNIVKLTDEKEKAIRKINLYLLIKMFLNVIVASAITLVIVIKVERKDWFLVILTPLLSFFFSLLDSIILYRPIQYFRKLDCSKWKYYQQVIGDNIMLYIFWFAASLFYSFGGRDKDDYVYMLLYFFFWIIINYLVIIARKYIMDCKLCTNEKLKRIVEKNKMEGYRIYEYDGKSRKTANAMVDSFFGIGNIYFSDYLLEHLEEDEIEAIYLHEIGHIKKHHITIRNVLLMMCMPFMYCVGVVMDEVEKYHSINIPLGILICSVIMIGYMIFLYLYISRKQEYVADYYAAVHVNNSETLCTALKKLTQLNDVLGSSSSKDMLKTHPAVDKRIEKIKKMNKEGSYR